MDIRQTDCFCALQHTSLEAELPLRPQPTDSATGPSIEMYLLGMGRLPEWSELESHGNCFPIVKISQFCEKRAEKRIDSQIPGVKFDSALLPPRRPSVLRRRPLVGWFTASKADQQDCSAIRKDEVKEGRALLVSMVFPCWYWRGEGDHAALLRKPQGSLANQKNQTNLCLVIPVSDSTTPIVSMMNNLLLCRRFNSS